MKLFPDEESCSFPADEWSFTGLTPWPFYALDLGPDLDETDTLVGSILDEIRRLVDSGNTSERARYYLEQTLDNLKELNREE